jgi:predicted phosphodiesterase
MSNALFWGDLHATHMNGRASQLETIADFVKDWEKDNNANIDLLGTPGDFIGDPNSRDSDCKTLMELIMDAAQESDKVVQRNAKIMQQIREKHEKDHTSITEEDQKRYGEAHQEIEKSKQSLIEPFQRGYHSINVNIEKLRQLGKPILGVRGNWDLKSAGFEGVDLLEDMISRPVVTSEGNTIEIKGSENTHEVPGIYSHIAQQSPLFRELWQKLKINYELGHSYESLDEIDELKDEEGNPIPEDIKYEIKKMHELELERLRDGVVPDYFITHSMQSDDLKNNKNEDNGKRGYSTETYLNKDLKNNSEPVIISGHKHKTRIDVKNGKLNIRLAPDEFAIVRRNDKTKTVEKIELYKVKVKDDDYQNKEEYEKFYKGKIDNIIQYREQLKEQQLLEQEKLKKLMEEEEENNYQVVA